MIKKRAILRSGVDEKTKSPTIIFLVVKKQ
jgi:hypothetical protein